MASTYNQTLKDVVITIDGMGPDDGAETAAASPTTLCVDSFSIQFTSQLVDVSCNADISEWYRCSKKGFDISITTKVGEDDMDAAEYAGKVLDAWDSSVTNSLFLITVLIGGETLTFETIVENAGFDGSEPPTFTANFRPYGEAMTHA